MTHGRRRERAEEERRATRTRVIEVATRLFETNGYRGTTMADIAREAGVAVQSVYTAGRSKADLLNAAVARAVAGDDQEVLVHDRPGFRRHGRRTEPCPTSPRDGRNDLPDSGALRADAVGTAGGGRIRPIGGRQSGRGAPTPIGDLPAIIGILPEAQLRSTPEASTDTVWAVASAEVFLLLRRVPGWSWPEIRSWLSGLLVDVLLVPPAPGREPGGRVAPLAFVPFVQRDGMWRSLAARLLWEQEVPGSNPGIPTTCGRPGWVDRGFDTTASIPPKASWARMPAVADAPTGHSGGVVLLTLATAQFLMTLDSSVMNVSIATVAKDVGTTVTGIQLAITLYTLVMAAFMITGGKVGQIIGRRRAFMVGCVIYGFGSFTTSLAHSLPVLLIGWSILEGLGATLIMPSVVALVATNFGASERPRAYGLIASASAIAVAAGPLIGGLCTTYLTWRVVFAGEVVLVVVILALSRRVTDARVKPTSTWTRSEPSFRQRAWACWCSA